MTDLQYPQDFEQMRPELQNPLVEQMRQKIVDQVMGQTEEVIRDAIPKALAAKCGLAFRSDIEAIPAHPLWDAQSREVRHTVRFVLTDHPPNRDWRYLPYEELRELWEKNCVQPAKS